MKTGALGKGRKVATQELTDLCESRERVQYERDGLQVKQQLTQCECENFVDAVIRVQSGFG